MKLDDVKLLSVCSVFSLLALSDAGAMFNQAAIQSVQNQRTQNQQAASQLQQIQAALPGAVNPANAADQIRDLQTRARVLDQVEAEYAGPTYAGPTDDQILDKVKKSKKRQDQAAALQRHKTIHGVLSDGKVDKFLGDDVRGKMQTHENDAEQLTKVIATLNDHDAARDNVAKRVKHLKAENEGLSVEKNNLGQQNARLKDDLNAAAAAAELGNGQNLVEKINELKNAAAAPVAHLNDAEANKKAQAAAVLQRKTTLRGFLTSKIGNGDNTLAADQVLEPELKNQLIVQAKREAFLANPEARWGDTEIVGNDSLWKPGFGAHLKGILKAIDNAKKLEAINELMKDLTEEAEGADGAELAGVHDNDRLHALYQCLAFRDPVQADADENRTVYLAVKSIVKNMLMEYIANPAGFEWPAGEAGQNEEEGEEQSETSEGLDAAPAVHAGDIPGEPAEDGGDLSGDGSIPGSTVSEQQGSNEGSSGGEAGDPGVPPQPAVQKDNAEEESQSGTEASNGGVDQQENGAGVPLNGGLGTPANAPNPADFGL